MAQTLQTYLATTRFILEDALSTIWSDTQLTLCINQARQRVISDAQCARAIAFIPTVPGQEVYTFNTILSAVQGVQSLAVQVQTVVNCNFQQSPSWQFALKRLGWPEFNAIYRIVPLIATIPSACCVYGQNLYIGPRPANSPLYQLEIDVVWLPAPMSMPTDIETAIPDPYGALCVPLMAARWAHLNRRENEEGAYFEGLYLVELNSIGAAEPAYAVDSWY